MTARTYSWTGLFIIVVGIVDLIWTQVSHPNLIADEASYRWQVATMPIEVIALGILICVAAQILAAFGQRVSN
ncbi:MAG: hypothetical protein M3Q30_19435 [Actinomycetota bacterium]|nr:hypothetical protein [Actinomycetota bacterium]